MRGTVTPTLDRLRRLNAELDEYNARATVLRGAYEAQCQTTASLYQPNTKSRSWLTAAAAAQRSWDHYQDALDNALRVRMLITGIEHRGQMRLHKVRETQHR